MKIITLYIALLLITPSTVFAGNDLSLKEAISHALDKNNLLKAAGYEKIAATREVSASYSRFMPRIFLDETGTASNSPTRVFMMKLDEGRFSQNDFAINNLNHPSAQGDFRTSLNLDMPLFDANIYHGMELAKAGEKGRSFAFERKREEIAFMVYTAYLEVQKSRGFLTATEQAVTGAREHQRLAIVRSEAGTGLKSDELRARTFLSEMEQMKITARNNLTLAKLRLAQVIGNAPGESIDIREELRPLPMTSKIEDLQHQALMSRSDLKEMATGMEKADISVKQARSSYFPTLYGVASYQMNDRDIPFGRDNDSWTVGANLRWELFDGMRRANEKGKAEAMRDSATEYLENYRKEIALQVEESVLRCEEAGNRLDVARNSAQDAEEVVRLISRRYENSLATFVDLLDAQSALNKARAHMIGNETDYAQATARIYYSTGTFLKEVLR